jgi:D-alanyl-lipoteichoic acid acyltransferase DltB (MBOAT superfamily)
VLYWFVTNKHLNWQNGLLLGASYFFYGYWDVRFLFLLIFSTLLDYFSGIQMDRAENEKYRKFWFWLSVVINLGFLGLFKYYNFFAASFALFLQQLGIHINVNLISVILPVGISFYTFHGLSYVIDIYKRKIKPEYNFINYAVFVSFFPLLVAGPIERATHLLPQIQTNRIFNYHQAVNGLRQILWGLMKKMVIADSCAVYVNQVFSHTGANTGSTLFIGAILFAFQIYCDFSGYSDIAIGTANLFGISLLRNFAFPYFSRDIAEFWRRWHISLSSWFRDYVYIPLGGSKSTRWKSLRNIFIIFLLSGFWHGANFTFIAWGLLNALYFVPLFLVNRNRLNTGIAAEGRILPDLITLFQILLTFLLTVFAWIFFRAENLNEAFQVIQTIFSASFFQRPKLVPATLVMILLVFVCIEWMQRNKQHPFQIDNYKIPTIIRWSMYFGMLLFIYVFRGTAQNFIYFKF